MSKRMKLPKGWRSIPISDSAQFINGRGFKKAEWVDQGLPIIRIQNLNDPAKPFNCYDGTYSQDIYIEDGDMLFSWSASLGVFLWDRGPALLNQHIFKVVPHAEVDDSFLYYALQHVLTELKTHGSTMKHITKEVLDTQKIPLPPLAVQERIVEVLQQADAIRRKRAEARRLADQILPALFLDMFGDPATNPKAWPMTSLDAVLTLMKNGTTADQNTKGKGYPVSRIETISYETIDSSRVRWVDLDDKQFDKWRMKPGDILFSHINSIEHIAKTALYLGDPSVLIHGMNLLLLRPNQQKCLPVFLHAFLKTPTTRDTFRKIAKPAVNQASLNQKDLKSLQIPLPPLDEQKRFVYAAEEIQAQMEKQTTSVNEAEGIFSMFLSHAFTGELTVEWEAANEKWITERQAFYKRLPRLAVLSLLLERCERAGRDAVTLITALMKYTFLAQMEGELHRQLYRFVPYHYGPCAMELYDDLKALAADGLIAIENDAEEDKTRITLTDPDRTAALLEDEAKKDDARLAALEQAEEEADAETDPAMPRLLKRRAETLDALRTDAATILDTYGDLDHTALLKTVYEKYPAYAKKSRAKAKRRRK